MITESAATGDAAPVLPLRTRQRHATRQSLVDAARTLFADRGYAATTTEDIARAAGASRATFYLYFKTKSEIVAAILEPFRRRSYELGRRVGQLPQMAPADVTTWVADWARAYEERSDDLRVVSIAMASDSSFVTLVDQDVIRLVEELAANYPRLQNESAARTAQVLIRMMFAMLERYCHDLFVHGLFEFDDIVERTSASWHAYFVPQLLGVMTGSDEQP